MKNRIGSDHPAKCSYPQVIPRVSSGTTSDSVALLHEERSESSAELEPLQVWNHKVTQYECIPYLMSVQNEEAHHPPSPPHVHKPCRDC